MWGRKSNDEHQQRVPVLVTIEPLPAGWIELPVARLDPDEFVDDDLLTAWAVDRSEELFAGHAVDEADEVAFIADLEDRVHMARGIGALWAGVHITVADGDAGEGPQPLVHLLSTVLAFDREEPVTIELLLEEANLPEEIDALTVAATEVMEIGTQQVVRTDCTEIGPDGEPHLSVVRYQWLPQDNIDAPELQLSVNWDDEPTGEDLAAHALALAEALTVRANT